MRGVLSNQDVGQQFPSGPGSRVLLLDLPAGAAAKLTGEAVRTLRDVPIDDTTVVPFPETPGMEPERAFVDAPNALGDDRLLVVGEAAGQRERPFGGLGTSEAGMNSLVFRTLRARDGAPLLVLTKEFW